MRYRTLFFTVPGLVAVVGLVGCGSEQAKDSGSGGSGTVQPSPAAQTDLTVSVKATANAPAKTWKLTCDPVGGDHPDAKNACAALAKAKTRPEDPFAPTPSGQICTYIYGGPQIATIKGTLQGKQVDATFTRKNGCELKRWSDLGPVFGKLPPANLRPT
jgi:hypothetical protein